MLQCLLYLYNNGYSTDVGILAITYEKIKNFEVASKDKNFVDEFRHSSFYIVM